MDTSFEQIACARNTPDTTIGDANGVFIPLAELESESDGDETAMAKCDNN